MQAIKLKKIENKGSQTGYNLERCIDYFSANMSVMVCGNDDLVNRILEHSSRNLRVIVTIRDVRRHTLERAALLGIQVSLKLLNKDPFDWTKS